jgi:hypothetical protein
MMLTAAACNGTIVADSEMGEVIQLQGDQRKDVQEFLVAKDGLELDAKTIKVSTEHHQLAQWSLTTSGSRFLNASVDVPRALLSHGGRITKCTTSQTYDHWELTSHSRFCAFLAHATALSA